MALIDEINVGTPRQTVITFPDGDHEDIMSGFKSGSIELEEILCDGESLLFGGCASNMFSSHLVSDDILGKKIKVYQKIGEYTEDIFTGYVDSLLETNERTYHKLIAYDEIQRHGADNVAEWYNDLWTIKESYTLKEFRDSFFAYLGINQVDVELVNDGMIITKNISGESIPAIDIMKAICEINGVFGNINRQGLFDYVSLSNVAAEFVYKSSNSTFETYSCEPITRVRVIEDTDDVGAVVGEEGNTYTVCGNILTYGTGAEERTEIASNLLSEIAGVTYRPADMVAVISNPSIRLGDRLVVDINGKETQTYVLKNRLYGVQLFGQRIEAEGVVVYSETDIDVNSEIQRIKSKQLKITKTVEEFKTEVVDSVREAKSMAQQTVDKINWLVQEGEEESSLEMTSEAIEAVTKRLIIKTPDGKTVLIEGGAMYIDRIIASSAFIEALSSNEIIVEAKQNAEDALEEVKNTIKDITIHYLATSSSGGVTTSTSGWSTTIQSITTSKKYLWTYQKITYVDGKTSNTTPVISGVYGDAGEKGAPGTDGKGISKITEYYQISTSNTTAPTTWQTTVPTMTSTNKYLWNYETITYTDNTTTDTTKRVIGVYGATGASGKGISKIENYYLATSKSSEITTSTSGWTTTIQAITSTNKYLWNYEVVTYTDGSNTTTTPIIIGAYGEKGATGTSVSKVIPLFYLKSNTTAPSAPISAVTSTSTSSGAWTTAVPAYVSGYTYFTCTQTLYADNKYGWSTVVIDNGLTNANANATNALDTINSLEVGGTNLLPDTNINTLNAVAGDVSRYWSDSSMADHVSCEFIELTDSPVKGLKYGVRQTSLATSGGNNGRNLTWRGSEKIELIDGEEYTLSCYARIISGTQARLRFRFYNSGNQTYLINITNTVWKRISQTIKVNKTTWGGDYCNIGCGGLCDTYAATVELCGFKLEKGNKATDWSPAPEDVDFNVETANTNATNALNRATHHYGTCSTAAGTAAKAVTLSGFELYTGAQVTVQFTNANTAANPTLNVNGTGAKNIRVNNANISAKYYWSANNTVTFVYNGSYWVMSDTSVNTILANWCSTNDKTLIDGGKIYTGSVTAKQIDVENLFAQDINATGTITGAKLYGASGEFEGDISSYGTLTLYTGYVKNLPDGKQQYIKDAGKIEIKVSGDSNVQGVAPSRVYINIDSHSDDNHTAILRLTKKNGVVLSEENEDGENGTYIQFGALGVGNNSRLSVKPNFKYKESDTFETVEVYNTPHIQRIMIDKIAAGVAYLEKLISAKDITTSLLTIKNIAIALADGAVQNMLGVQYKDAGEQIFTTYPIRVVGSTQTNPYNAAILLGSNNGTTIVGAGESSGTMPKAIGAYNNENLYLIADGRIEVYTGCSNDAATYKKALVIGTDGNVVFLNKVTAVTFDGTATKIQGNYVNPTDKETWYAIPFYSGGDTTGSKVISSNAGCSIGVYVGTAETEGRMTVVLGNKKPTGEAGNMRGCLRLYDKNANYANLYFGNGNTTASRNIYLPDAEGTLALNTPASPSADGLMTSADKTKMNAIGTYLSTAPDGVSFAAQSGSTGTKLASLKLPAGTYVVTCAAHFPTSSSASVLGTYRRATLDTTSGKINASRGYSAIAAPIYGQTTMLQISNIIVVSSETTYYLNGQTDSSEPEVITGLIKAVRIA